MSRQDKALESSASLPEFAFVEPSRLTAKVRHLKVEIAQAAIEAFYRRHPAWRALFGEEAAQETREQVVLHVEMLAAAIDVGSPEAFARYVHWLVRVVQARGMTARLVSEHFEDLEADLRTRLSSQEHRIARTFTAAASAAVDSPVASNAAREIFKNVLTQERNRFLTAILEGRRESAVRIARQALRAGYPAVTIYVELFQYALYQVGQLWEANRIATVQEHLAAAVVHYVMAQVHALVSHRGGRRSSYRGRAVLSGVEGERHQLGVQMIADLLENDGWNVWFLGTDLPAECIVEAVELHQADVLGISASMLWSLPRAKRVIAVIRDALGPAAPRVVLGGTAFRALPDVARKWGADAVALDAAAAIQCFARFQARPNADVSAFWWPWVRKR